MRRTQRPKERSNAGQPEKRPVSCLFCRSRKLRCTREFPCSNCLERGIICELRPANHASSVKTPLTASPHASDVSQTEILQRLRRLEEIVLNSRKGHDTFKEVEPREVLSSPAPSRLETCASTPPKFQPLTADIARLEKVAMGESFSVSNSKSVYAIHAQADINYLRSLFLRMALSSWFVQSSKYPACRATYVRLPSPHLLPSPSDVFGCLNMMKQSS